MSDEVMTRNVALPDDENAKKKGNFVIGVGDSDQTVLKNATVENSSIGHIGDQIDVKDGGKVMTSEAVAAEAKLKQAKAEDNKEKVKNAIKDAVVPGHKLIRDISDTLNNVTGAKKSPSRYDKAINELCNGNAQVNNDIEISK